MLRLFPIGRIERRQSERVRAELAGTCKTVANEYPCETVDLSTSGVAIKTRQPSQIGERMTANIDSIGAIEGTIARRLEEGWAIRVDSPTLRDKLAHAIASLIASEQSEKS